MALVDAERSFLRRAFSVALRAREGSNHPFGALLVGPGGQVLAEAENTVVTTGDCTGHAELNLVRAVSQELSPEQLAACTLYSSCEPCAMCAGAIHWSGVGRLIYGCSTGSLLETIARQSDGERRDLNLSCRDVLGKASQPIAVIGPALEAEAIRVHDDFWGDL